LISLAKPCDQIASDGGEQLNSGSRLKARQNTECRSRDAEKLAGIGGGDARGTRTIVNEGNFTEKIAGRKAGKLDFSVTAFHGHSDASAQDHVHAMSDVAGIDDTLAGTVRFDRALLEQDMKLIGSQLGENRELCQLVIKLDLAW